jgi:uncharacterized phiE125 gp8 family phage protein
MAKLTLITAPVLPAVTVEEFQTHTRLGGSDEETYIGDLLAAAEEEAESETWRRIVTQTWDQYFDGFANPLTLWYPPVPSVTNVKYLDTDGSEQTLSTDVWELGEEDGIGIVRLKYNQSWPVPYGHPDSVYVRFICGYGVQADDPKTIPAKIRQAIRFHAAWFYRNREGGELPQAFSDYLSPYSVRRFVPVG